MTRSGGPLKLCLQQSIYPCLIYLYLGPIAQTNTGELVVYPGTILHMECLFLKKFGSPSWTTRRGFKPKQKTKPTPIPEHKLLPEPQPKPAPKLNP